MTLKVLVIEDHELYREGLELLLKEVIPGVQLVTAADFPSARHALSHHPDIALILLDIQIPGTNGLEGLEAIKNAYPALPLVVISSVNHYASIRQMLNLGADGFIAKSSSKATMIQGLHDVLNGEKVIVGEQAAADVISLSPRQLTILELMALGLSNKEIAAQLNISPATVREYVSDLLFLFSCDNRTQAVLKARSLGFILGF